MNDNDADTMAHAAAVPISGRALMEAAARDDVAVLHDYVAQGGTLDFVCDGTTSLIYAIDHGSIAFALAAIEAGANPASPHRRRNALSAAVERGLAMVVARLLALPAERRVDIDNVDYENRTCLYVAAANGCATIVGMLLDAGASCRALGRERTPAQQAALGDGGDEARATMLAFIEREPDRAAFLSTKPGDGAPDSLVHLAGSAGHPQMLEFLLDQGALVDADDGDGTPLFRACAAGNIGCISKLAQRGATMHWPGQRLSPLTLVLRLCPEARQSATVGALLALGLDPDAPDDGGRVPRAMAAGKPEVMQVLAAHDARRAMAAVLSKAARPCSVHATVHGT